MKKCVYLVIIGDYNDLHEPTVITPGWDYICFTDNPKLVSEHWDIRLVADKGNIGDKKFSRAVWRQPHLYLADYDLSISIGGQSYPNCDLDEFIAKFLSKDDSIDMVMHDRGIRKGVYAEIGKCISKKKDNPKVLKAQMAHYKEEGLPDDTGLFSGGVIIQKHNRPHVQEHCRLWWEEMKRWSYRDQISFNYVLWKYKLIKVHPFPQDVLRFKGNYFQKRPHKGMDK